MNPPVQHAYEALHDQWGDQHWWPARTRMEMMLGAILTQNTAWTNVEKAMAVLRRNNAVKLETLDATPVGHIAEWIRPAGYFNQKAGYIKAMTGAIRNRFGGSINLLFALDTPALRKELLSWKGIGPETADAIMLYAGKRPVFVADAYTKRFLERHRWCDRKASYNEVAQLFTDNLPKDVQLYNEYHALIVRLGKEHCRTKPQCQGCPLEKLL